MRLATRFGLITHDPETGARRSQRPVGYACYAVAINRARSRTRWPLDRRGAGTERSLHGDSKQDAIQRAQSAAREIVLDRITMASCLPIRPMQCSTLPHECLACGEGAPRIRVLQRNGWRHDPTVGSHNIHEKGWR